MSQNVDCEQFKEIVPIRKQERLGDYLEKFNADNQENYLNFIDGLILTWKL